MRQYHLFQRRLSTFFLFLLPYLSSSIPPKTNSSTKTGPIIGCKTLLAILILTFLIKLVPLCYWFFIVLLFVFVGKPFVVACISKTIVDAFLKPNRTLWKIVSTILLSIWRHVFHSLEILFTNSKFCAIAFYTCKTFFSLYFCQIF